MGFRGASRFRGQRPKWMRFAADVRFVDISKGTEGGTLLHFDAPRFGEVAEEVYRQGLLFGSIPLPQDTAFDIMGNIIDDVAREVRDSERFDTGILQRLEHFKHPIFDRGVDELRLLGGRLPTASPRTINRCIADAATSLYEQTPAPIRARLSGRLDMIRASDKVFSMILEDGRQVRGIWLGESIQPRDSVGARSFSRRRLQSECAPLSASGPGTKPMRKFSGPWRRLNEFGIDRLSPGSPRSHT